MDFIPQGEKEKEEMLSSVGAASFDDLLADIPEEVRLARPLGLGRPLSEFGARQRLADLAGRNASADRWLSFLGGGAYDHLRAQRCR